ncbi:molybdopterin molybdotransferase MoeA [Pontibaca methylaminivorans]|uniref:Molybdopterin molybdenumtransferase n=1 Tax=Pontibaca methylaminivorans TaxID=515897 RepID=A0A1R3X403_9RHOB|nr:gephyrin-like molybdotransferase Glp [Pontibaca methylaminivorans]SIT84155.1 molybdopterin molybdotransferase [Pontibaca methylaminivorans]
MIPVEEARAQLFDLVAPLPAETVPLIEASGRVLARDLRANRAQPPFDASAMDGYAIRAEEAVRGAMFKVIGESAAGHGFSGPLGAGQAVRIFTGAPLPAGAGFVVIQEDTQQNGDVMTITADPGTSHNIRPAGSDFAAGATVSAPRRLTPADIALLASMNIADVPVTRRPRVAVLSTGDELVMPGEDPGPDQIIASNSFGLHAMLRELGAEPRLLPIARDTLQSLREAFETAEGADLVVTIGGASVGDHDLVGEAAARFGLERAFYKVAMRPGKPLMAGRMGAAAMVGLPGNPVSAMVCGHVFLAPMIRILLGLDRHVPDLRQAFLAEALSANGPREHYMRAVVRNGEVRAFDRQDSALLTVLSQANALLVRPPHDPPRRAGESIGYLPISRAEGD